jgi:hypothetical protein
VIIKQCQEVINHIQMYLVRFKKKIVCFSLNQIFQFRSHFDCCR